jgi:hypothetical protein
MIAAPPAAYDVTIPALAPEPAHVAGGLVLDPVQFVLTGKEFGSDESHVVVESLVTSRT